MVIFQAYLGTGYPRLSWLATKLMLYENLTYGSHVAHSYRVKLQHQEYTE